jgi:tetratricopeptide (TPR) repeat protein
LSKDGDPQSALGDYKRAKEVGADDWRNWHHLARFLDDIGEYGESLTLAEEASQKFPDEDLIKIHLARAYLHAGRFEDCYSVLENATILPFEGQRDVHRMFVQCQIGAALENLQKRNYREALKWLEGSKEFPERLGSGRPHNPDFRVQDYLMMLCYEALGHLEEVEKARSRLYEYASSYPKRNVDVVGRKVGLWQQRELQEETTLDALQALYELVVGERRRR